MAHAYPAPTGAIRPLTQFIIRIRTASGPRRFVTLARSSGEALGLAVTWTAVDGPFCASVKPAFPHPRA